MRQRRPNKKGYICVFIHSFRGLLAVIATIVLLDPISVLESKTTPPSSGLESFSRLVKQASPSVVNISAVRIIKRSEEIPSPSNPADPLKEFFDRFFRDRIPGEFKQHSLGTGFIIDKEGFILTNNHVVEQTDEIKVKLADNRQFSADIVGRDPLTDLALIRIEPDHPLSPLPLGDSDKIEVGDWVVAIGNPFGLGQTVTAGIVSAMYRQIGAGPYENFIQTDAPINPGNSGGPLLNTAGAVIGITTLIFSQGGGSLGIGFAIPVNVAKDLLPQLKRGRVIRGWMGVTIQKITPELKAKLKLPAETGALVSDVIVGGPAEKSGVRRGDVIISFDGRSVKDSDDLPQMVASTPVGSTVAVKVVRSGQTKIFQVTVEELQEDIESLAAKEEDRMELGLVLQQVTPELARHYGLPRTSGFLVVEVEIDTAADEAGFEPGDIILEVDQAPARDLSMFNRKMRELNAGDIVLFLVDRGGTTLFITLKIWQ